MAVYMIVEATRVFDKAKYDEYIRRVPQVIARFGGKYLARGGQAEVLCGNWNPRRVIIVEFESMEKFKAWWHSPEYRAVAPLREQGAETNAIVIAGTEKFFD